MFLDLTSGWRITARTIDIVIDLVDDRGEVREPLHRDVGGDEVAHELQQFGQLPQQRPILGHGIAQREQDLLLSAGPGEVALARALAGSRIGEGIDPTEVVLPGLDAPAGVRVAEARVVGIGEAVLHRDVDPADRVDDVDEPVEVDAGVVVDVDPEQRTDGRSGASPSPLRGTRPRSDRRTT